MTPLQRQPVGVTASRRTCGGPWVYLGWAAALFAFVPSVVAQTLVFTWKNPGTTGDFSAPGSWLINLIPGSTGLDIKLLIDGGATGNSIANVQTTPAFAINSDLTISSGDSLALANGVSFTLNGASGGTIVNHGTFALNAAANYTNLILSGGTLTWSGTGALTLSNSPNNRVYGAAGTEQLINSAGHTIQGAGQIGVNLLTISNQGLILANQSNALVIDPSSGGFINTGTLRATAGATLQLINGTFTNTGGLIQADDTSHVDLSAVTVTGGTLTSINSGKIRALSNSTLSDITLTAGSNLELGNANRLNLSGTIANAGTIQLLAVGNYTDLVTASGGATLSGGGTITLSNSANNRIYGATSTTTLINENNTISGAGQLGVNILQLDNRSTISASYSGATLEIDPSGSGVINTGTLQAINGGILRLDSGTFTNTGGMIHAATGSRVDLASAAIVGGSLSTAGTGVIRTVNAGNTLGGVLTLTLDSQLALNNATNLTLLSSGTFTNLGTITLNGAANFTDLILSGGDLTLGGTGQIALSNSVNNRIYGSASTDRLINTLTHTIAGSGQIGVNVMGLINHGTISANQALPLTIDPSAAGVTNSGALRAVSGATLRLENGTFANTPTGTIGAHGVGSVVDFSGATVSGGQLLSVDGASLRNTSASSFANLSFAAGTTFEVLNATTATFLGTITNNASVALSAGLNFTNLVISGGDVTLQGGGTITFSNSVNNRIYGALGTDRLINIDNVIQGSGQIGANVMGLVNQGTIKANQSSPLTIDPSASGVTNTGLLRAEAGATLELQAGAFNNAGGVIEAFGPGSRVNFDNAAITSGRLTSSGGGTLRNIAASNFTNVTLDPGATLQILNATNATFHGTLQNGGIVQLLGGANFTDFIVGAGGLTLSGGIIDFSASANNRLYGSSGSTLINESATIRGAGQIGVNLLHLDNRGTIDAHLSGATLTIDPNGSGVINTGLLTASNGGILRLDSGTFTNTGGTIGAGAGSRVDLSNATVQGGLLGGSVIRNVATSTLSGLSIVPLTVVEVPNATNLTLLGVVSNSGTVQLQAGGNFTDLIIGTGGATLIGGGTIELSNSANNRIYGVSGATTLINVDTTIRGSGQLGVNQLTLTNTGTIEANQSMALTVNLSGATPFNNQGILRASNGGNLVFVDNLVNSFAIVVQPGSTFTAQGTLTQSAGFISLQSGTLTAASTSVQAGSGVQGSGTINGAFTSSGVIAPGAGGSATGIGTLTFNQTLTLTSTSLLHFELGGVASFDRVQAPTAFLAGNIAVSFANGFQGSVLATDSFTLLSTTNGTGLSGTFAGVANGGWLATNDGLGQFQVNYGANSFTLSNFQAIPEPSTHVLLGLGGLALLAVFRTRRR